jgi:hypothetical protein
MKRILVERRPNEFCMIFQEQGTLGPSAAIVRMEPTELTRYEGERVLRLGIRNHRLVVEDKQYTR